MQSLTLDDLLPLEEFAARRREFHDTLQRYLDRYRRARVGPRVTLVFENRQTLWYRVQDMLRIARLAEPALVQRELNLYNQLLPGPGCLQAALLLHIPDDAHWSQELALWRTLESKQVRLHVGPLAMASRLVTCRPEDRTIGTAHWVQFEMDLARHRALADFGRSAHFEVTHGDYNHVSPPLSDDLRQSLLDDLALSDRDA